MQQIKQVWRCSNQSQIYTHNMNGFAKWASHNIFFETIDFKMVAVSVYCLPVSPKYFNSQPWAGGGIKPFLKKKKNAP